jgi:transcriptional repressor NrdR
MRCPRCGCLDDKVVDSRQSREGDAIRRRRECVGCGARFTSYERLELELPLVVKRDGRREPWSREKVLRGVSAACEKRPLGPEILNAIVDRIEARLAAMTEAEISSRIVGDLVMEELRQLDEVAYVRFASVYQSFQTLSEFIATVDRVRGEPT